MPVPSLPTPQATLVEVRDPTSRKLMGVGVGSIPFLNLLRDLIAGLGAAPTPEDLSGILARLSAAETALHVIPASGDGVVVTGNLADGSMTIMGSGSGSDILATQIFGG